MLGLVGYRTGSTAVPHAREIREKVDRVDPLDPRSTRYEEHCADGCVIVATTVLPREPGVFPQTSARDGNLVLFLEGEIFEIGDRDVDDACPANRVCEFLIADYRRKGDAFVSALNGEFNIVVFDAGNGSLKLWADHVASQPMYWFESANGFCFGSEKKFIQAVVTKSWEIDPVGLLQPLVHVHNIGSRTFVKGISRMLPGESIHVARDGKVRRSISEYIDFQKSASGNGAALLDEWESQLTSATNRRFKDDRRVSMSLSAGLDSRAISASIDRAFRPIRARTWGDPASHEVRFAKQIAERLDFQLMHQDPTTVRHSDGIHSIVWRTEGEIPYKNGVSFFAHDAMKSDADFLAGGWLGDASSGAHLRPFMFLPSGRRSFIDRIYRWYRTGSAELLSRIFNEEFVHRHMPEIESEFYESYDRFDQCDNATAHEFWDLMHRQTRMTISSMPVDSHRFLKARPFFDRRYLQFVMSLPVSARVGQHLYKSLIYRIGPEIRDVPNSNTGLTLKESAFPNLVDHLKSNQEKVLRRLFGDRVKGRSKDPVIPAENLADSIRRDPGIRQIIEAFLASDDCDTAIFNVAGIHELLAAHYESGADYSVPIAWMATYSLSLPCFVYGQRSEVPTEARGLRPTG